MWKSAMEAMSLVTAAPSGAAPQAPPCKFPARLYQDDIDNIRRAPMSDKGRISREKLKSAVARDEESWKELQAKMRGTNLCTHAGLMMVLNQSILLDVGVNTVKREVDRRQMRIGFEEKERSSSPMMASYRLKHGKHAPYEKDERSEEIVATIKQMLQSVGGLGTSWRDTPSRTDDSSVCSDSNLRQNVHKTAMSRRAALQKRGSSQSLSPPREEVRRRQITSLSPLRDSDDLQRAATKPRKLTNTAFLAMPLTPKRERRGNASSSPVNRSDVSDSDSEASLLLEEFPIRENLTGRRAVLESRKKASVQQMPQLSFCDEESSDEESEDETDFLKFFPSLQQKEQQRGVSRKDHRYGGLSDASSVQLPPANLTPLSARRKKRATSLPCKPNDSLSEENLTQIESKAESVRTYQTLNAAIALTSRSDEVNRSRAA